MIKFIKKFIFNSLSLENYLKLLQRGYFVLYNTGLLKFSSNYSYHYYVRNLINKGDVILDIGANLGYYSILFAKWTGPTGKVYAVEPIAVYNTVYNKIAKKHSNIVLYPYALGVEEKTIEMVTSSHAGYLNTGLPHVHDPNRDGNIEEQEFRFSAEMKIPSKLFGTLDHIDYIKCDIEGFEYIVLSDMEEIIKKHKPIIQVEIWGENEEKINTLLSHIGYISHKLIDKKLVALEDKHGKINGDYIFIHRDNKILN